MNRMMSYFQEGRAEKTSVAADETSKSHKVSVTSKFSSSEEGFDGQIHKKCEKSVSQDSHASQNTVSTTASADLESRTDPSSYQKS